MRRIVEKIITESKKITFDVNEIESLLKSNQDFERKTLLYKDLANSIVELEEEGKIIPVKSSKRYFMDKRIYNRYKKVKREEKKNLYKDEVLTGYHPNMAMSSYIKNVNLYKKDREVLKIISKFLFDKENEETFISVNERSYQLFGNEKLLAEDWNEKKLVKIGLTYEDLFCYPTYEPFFYYGSVRHENESVLIVENKDTFYSLKKLFLEGVNAWDGIAFSMLIYGEGNKITNSIHFLEELAIPKNTRIYYFGDFDPMGITIFNRIKESNTRPIDLMTLFYREMWKYRKNGNVSKKQDWNEQAIHSFCSYFEEDEQTDYLCYLRDNKYIPQEALTIELLRRLSNEFRKTV
jgi:hypothetical protein